MANRGRGVALTLRASSLAVSGMLLLGACADRGSEAPSPSAARTTATAEIGKLAPDISMTALTGGEKGRFRIGDLKGRPVIINFWASWCVPCRREFDLFKQVQAESPGVAIVGVVFEDSEKAALRFMRSEGASWIAVSDPDGSVARAYGVKRPPGIPQTYFVGPDGKVTGKVLGEIRQEDLDAEIDRASR